MRKLFDPSCNKVLVLDERRNREKEIAYTLRVVELKSEFKFCFPCDTSGKTIESPISFFSSTVTIPNFLLISLPLPYIYANVFSLC